jgi:hypothetical protein
MITRYLSIVLFSLVVACGGGDADTTAPALVTLEPLDGDGDVPTTAEVRAVFDEPLTDATDTVELTLAGVEGTTSYDADGNALVFTPAAPLAVAQSYQARLLGTVRDASGNADTTPPVLTESTPADGAVDVPPDIAMRLTFDEPLDPASVVPGALSLEPPVPFTVAYDPVHLHVTISPEAPLLEGVEHTVTVVGLTDRAGNAAAATVRFTTREGTEVRVSDRDLPGVGSPSAAFHPNGDGMAVWTVRSQQSTKVVFARYTDGVWGPQRDAGVMSDGARRVHVLAIDGGFVMLVEEYLSVRSFLYATSEDRWFEEGGVDPGASGLYSLSAAVSPSGTVAVVMLLSTGAGCSVYGNVRSQRWHGVTLLGSGSCNANTAIATQGDDIVAIWSNGRASYAKLTGTSWGTPVIVSSTGNIFRVAVAANASDAMVAYIDNNTARARVVTDATLGPETVLDTNTVFRTFPSVAANGSGYLVAFGTPAGLAAHRYTGTWSTAEVIDAGQTVESVWLASDGTSYVVEWASYSAVSNTIGHLALAAFDTTFGTPLTLSDDRLSAFSQAALVRSGATVHSVTADRGRVETLAVTGGAIGPRATLSNETDRGGVEGTAVASNGAGDVAVIWGANDGGYGQVRVSIFDAATRTFSAPVAFGRWFEDRAIVGNDSGFALAWDYNGESYVSVYQGGAWTPPELVAAADDLVTLAGSGNRYAVVYRLGGTEVFARVLDDGVWSSPVAIDLADGDVGSGLRLVGRGGSFTAAWTQGTYPEPYVLHTSSFDGTDWTTEPALGGEDTEDEVFLAINTTGTMLTWFDDGVSDAIKTALAPSGEPFGAPESRPFPSSSRLTVGADDTRFIIAHGDRFTGQYAARIFANGAWSEDVAFDGGLAGRSLALSTSRHQHGFLVLVSTTMAYDAPRDFVLFSEWDGVWQPGRLLGSYPTPFEEDEMGHESVSLGYSRGQTILFTHAPDTDDPNALSLFAQPGFLP